MDFSSLAINICSCSSVTQLCLILCDPRDCSTPEDTSALHYLPEFAQTHAHWISIAIQPSHPLSLPSPPALNLSQHQGCFQWGGPSHQVAKFLELQLEHQSFLCMFRVDLLEDWLVWSPCSSRDAQESSPAQFKSINSLMFTLLYGPSLTSIHDVKYKSALFNSIANNWTTKAFTICLYGDWTSFCYSCWPSTTPEGVQGGVRHSVLQGIWWDMSLDSWMFLGTDFIISILPSPHI